MLDGASRCQSRGAQNRICFITDSKGRREMKSIDETVPVGGLVSKFELENAEGQPEEKRPGMALPMPEKEVRGKMDVVP
jgi:hypothetical protein